MRDMRLLCQLEGCVAKKLSFSQLDEFMRTKTAKRQRNKDSRTPGELAEGY